jgi:hypothetical protein
MGKKKTRTGADSDGRIRGDENEKNGRMNKENKSGHRRRQYIGQYFSQSFSPSNKT